jgi:hypothetical protein
MTTTSLPVKNSVPNITSGAGTNAIPWTTGAGMTVGTGNITLNGGSHIYTTNTGGAGQVYTTNGTSGLNWATPTSPYDTVMKINQTNPPELEVKGRMVINGIDLEERLKTIEKVLCIPERDVILEKKYPKLKKLYDEYINALGKYRTFEAIKGEEDVA